MSTVPPLSQSKQALLACPLHYVETVIRGNGKSESMAAVRGRIIHSVLCKYVRELAKAKLKKHPEYFATLLKGLPADAREVLEPQGEIIEVNPEEIYQAEFYCALTEDFKPYQAPRLPSQDPELPSLIILPSYESTLDLVLVKDPSAATIIDWKSQFAAIEPDTFQARLYSLQLFMLNPQFEKVTFELRFVRWGGKSRSVTFERDDVPKLQAEARRYREMQVQLHKEAGEKNGTFEPHVFPGTHCVYCPLLGAGCPIEENPAEDVETSMLKLLYYREALKRFDPIVREHCNLNGPLHMKDGSGNLYEAMWDVSAQKEVSLDALPTLQKWDKQKERGFLQGLRISGLTTKLKAKKRADLADAIANFTAVKTKPRFRIGRVGHEEEHEQSED